MEDDPYKFPEQLATSMAYLKGNPHFDHFIEAIKQLNEGALDELESFSNVEKPMILARASGVISVTRQIISYANIPIINSDGY